MIIPLFHVFIIYLIDKFNIKLIEPKYEVIRICNYSIWTLLSIYGLLYNDYLFIFGDFITKSMILNYVYEMMYHKPDNAHIIHHLFTIITQLSSIYSGLYYIEWFQKITFYTYFATCTSILSSLRLVVKHNYIKYYNLTKLCYKLSFLFFKIIVMYPHYYIIYDNYNNNINNNELL